MSRVIRKTQVAWNHPRHCSFPDVSNREEAMFPNGPLEVARGPRSMTGVPYKVTRWLVAIFPVVLCGELRAEDSPKVKAAREILTLWAKGKNEDVAARSEPKMRAAMGAEKLAQAWTMAEFQYGK